MSKVLAFISHKYRFNYGSRCRSVSWQHPLHILQAVALCMRGHGLHALCKLFISNFRHFQGGAPDLLLIRGFRYVSYADDDNCCTCKAVRGSAAKSCHEDYQFIDLNEWLGSGWETLRDDASSTRWRNDESFVNDLNSLSMPVFGDRGAGKSADIENPNNSVKRWFSKEGASFGPDKEDLYAPQGEDGDLSADNDVVATEEIPENQQPRMSIRESRFRYSGADLKNPCRHCFEAHDRNIVEGSVVDSSVIVEEITEGDFMWVDNWTFECMLVEVKGPTDRLADRQAVWLHALSVGGKVPAVVCQIREGRNGQESGHHESEFATEDIL
jgi:hypothetical protein